MNLLLQLFSRIHQRMIDLTLLPKLLRRGLVVGKNFHMLDNVVIDPSHCWHITIGDDVTLATGVHIYAHDASTKIHLNYTKIGKVTIGNRVFIGAKSVVLPGVSIGDDVIIGAGSVVTRDIPSGALAAGNPARAIGNTNDFLSRRKAEMETYPCFGREYVSDDITDEMKVEMNRKMNDRFGFLP